MKTSINFEKTVSEPRCGKTRPAARSRGAVCCNARPDPRHAISHWMLAFVLFVLFALLGCASGSKLVDHAFSFDAVRESPDVQVLNYQYGNSKQPGARPPAWALQKEGYVAGGTSINGPMLQGDTLYVKWRIKSTNAVYEDTVDLRKRLPADITNHRIHFEAKGPQLYVYLISPQPNPPGWPTYDPPGYTHKKTYVIYPDPKTPNRFN